MSLAFENMNQGHARGARRVAFHPGARRRIR